MSAETLYSGPAPQPALLFPFLPEQLRRVVLPSPDVTRERRNGAVHTTFLDLSGCFAAQCWATLEDEPAFDPADPRNPAWWDGDPFEPGELPDELPELPEDEQDFDRNQAPEDWGMDAAPAALSTSVEISADSETPEVVAWCLGAGVSASVVGQWVWADPYKQLDLERFGGRERFDALLKLAGFRWSGRRQSFFHACTIPCKPRTGKAKRGGKLERFHSVTSAADFNPARHDPRPHHARKARKGKA